MRGNTGSIQKLIDFYDRKRFRGRDSNLEPPWVLYPYNVLFDAKAGSGRSPEEIQDAVECLDQRGPCGRTEWMEDGFVVGSEYWVFMGRALQTSIVFPYSTGLVAVGRQPSVDTIIAMRNAGRPATNRHVWIVYSLTESLHVRGVGPCGSHDQAMNWVPLEFPDQVP